MTVHVLGPWEAYPGGIAARRCVNCKAVQFLRYPGDKRFEWTRDGDHIRVTAIGPERTDAAVTCQPESEAAA